MNAHLSTGFYLPGDLIQAIKNLNFSSDAGLLRVQKELESWMYGLATHDSLESNLLVAEYARNRGILSFQTLIGWVDTTVKVPGFTDDLGKSILFISKKSISQIPELQNLLDTYDLDQYIGSEYRLIKISDDPSDEQRNSILSMIYSNYSRSVTSPLKQDIVPLIIAETRVNITPVVWWNAQRHISRSVNRKYRTAENRDAKWFSQIKDKHESHYKNFFNSTWGQAPDSVVPTISGLSANSGAIRYISSQIPPDAMSVLPGYFFLNEVDFWETTNSSVTENTQAFFCAIEPGYSGLWDDRAYQYRLIDQFGKFCKNAEDNPDKKYFLSIDITSNILGNMMTQTMLEQIKYHPNITTVISTSLTKYNRSEANYHYGMVAVFWGDQADYDTLQEYISTSYGDISRLWVLQFPKLRPTEISNIQDTCIENRKICMEVFLWFSGIREQFTVENHSAYSYIIPKAEDVLARNSLISSLLESPDFKKWEGSSFYNNLMRLCDVPDVACSRFHPWQDTRYKNSLRISWPTIPSRSEMEEFWNALATKILKVKSI